MIRSSLSFIAQNDVVGGLEADDGHRASFLTTPERRRTEVEEAAQHLLSDTVAE